MAIEKKSRLAHKARLSAELFVLGDERAVKDDRHCVLMFYKKVGFLFPEEKNSRYTFSVPEISFNEYRAGWIQQESALNRGKSYIGYIVTVLDSTGRVIFCDADISKTKWLREDLQLSAEKLRELYANNSGSVESRHFNDSFKKIDPPSIPWFQRARTN